MKITDKYNIFFKNKSVFTLYIIPLRAYDFIPVVQMGWQYKRVWGQALSYGSREVKRMKVAFLDDKA